jgi:hypothetical protein
MLDTIQGQEPVLKEVHLNTRDLMHLAAAREPLTMPTYTLELARDASHFIGVPVREDRRIPEGGAVGVFSDGRAQYFPPDA